MTNKKRIIVNAVCETDMEGCNEIERAIKLGKKFIPIKTTVTYMENPNKKFYISIELELEW